MGTINMFVVEDSETREGINKEFYTQLHQNLIQSHNINYLESPKFADVVLINYESFEKSKLSFEDIGYFISDLIVTTELRFRLPVLLIKPQNPHFDRVTTSMLNSINGVEPLFNIAAPDRRYRELSQAELKEITPKYAKDVADAIVKHYSALISSK